MILDNDTDFIYFSKLLSNIYPGFYQRLTSLLNENKIPYDMLNTTKDIWAVDYMPIQIEKEKFVLFNYRPSYLTKKYDHLRTIQQNVIDELDITKFTAKSSLKLDGGNLIKSSNKVIVTTRVVKENKKSEKEITEELIKLLQIDDVIFIPEPDKDLTGHADGIVRFYTDEQVLINDDPNDLEFSNKVEAILKNAKLDIIRIPYYDDPRKNSNADKTANGCYINFLETAECVIVPTFKNDYDDKAVSKFESLYSSKKKVLTCDSREIAEQGGVLNCITWNVKSWKLILEDCGEYYLVSNKT